MSRIRDVLNALTGKAQKEREQMQLQLNDLSNIRAALSTQVLNLTEKLVDLQKQPSTPDQKSHAFMVESFRRFLVEQDEEFDCPDWFEKFKKSYVVDQTKLKVYRLIAASLPKKNSSVEEVIDAVSKKGNQLIDLFSAPASKKSALDIFRRTFSLN